MKYLYYDIGGAATCAEFAIKYGEVKPFTYKEKIANRTGNCIRI